MIILPPLCFIADALTGAGGSLLGTAMSAVFNSYTANRDFKRQKELMDKQNSMNIANWQMQNEYNDPKNQINRLRNAGINPDLFYSNGASGIVNGASPASVSPSGVSSGSSLSTDFGQTTLQSMLLDAQKKNIDASTRKLNAEAGQTEATTPWVTELTKSTLALNEANAKVLNENVEKIRSETELNIVLSKIQSRQNEINEALKDTQIASSLAQLGASQKQSEVIMSKFADMYTAQLKLCMAQSYASYVQSDAAASNAQTNRAQQQLDAVIRHAELQVKRYTYDFQRSLAISDINVNNKTAEALRLQNSWRSDLEKSGKFGSAVHNILSIPVNALGGFFH